MARRRTTTPPRFASFINPITGLNQRGFCAGGYIDVIAHAKVREALEKVLNPAGFVLVRLRWWMQAQDPPDPVVRLEIKPPSSPLEQHDVRVRDEGTRPWAGLVGPTLVRWVKAQYSL